MILCESGTACGVDVRGGSPGTRETDCLAPTSALPAPNAFYLCGGSAFGLAGATGVQKYLEEKGIGFDAGVARVPIVSGAVIFDLNVGAADVRPDESMGMAACLNAGIEVAQGNVGAGTGATAGWAAGAARRMKSGLGTASVRTGGLIVGAIVAVNCFGDVVDPSTGEDTGRHTERDRGWVRWIPAAADGESAGSQLLRNAQHHRGRGHERPAREGTGEPRRDDGP